MCEPGVLGAFDPLLLLLLPLRSGSTCRSVMAEWSAMVTSRLRRLTSCIGRRLVTCS